jgi:(p)ppGpp synthase/HD superfamily hydrolase
MVTRSHLQLVEAQAQPLEASRTRLIAAGGAQAALIEQALELVQPLYETRTLAGGRPLLTHVLDVAQTLAELRLDANTLAAALLYPAYESSPALARTIRDRFGVAVAELAEGVVRMAHIGALPRQASRNSTRRSSKACARCCSRWFRT